MKAIPCGPGGLLENVIKLVGYDTLCLMSIDNPGLLSKIFDGVGQALVDYYKIVVPFDSVGAPMTTGDSIHKQCWLQLILKNIYFHGTKKL
jgi:hypothetical protein